jgi:tetratricopeptide (TPR) repeat protein
MPVVIEGTLLKEGFRTRVCRPRHIRFLSDGTLQYWQSAPRVGEPPRGEGCVTCAEEWWPQRAATSHRKLLKAVSQNVGSGVSYATEQQYDGRTFLITIRCASSGGKETDHAGAPKLQTWHLIAPSRAERCQWLSAIAANVDALRHAADTAPTVHADDDDAAPAGAAPQGVDAEMQSVLDELPEVWARWNEHGEHDGAMERYAELLRRAPSCWQLLQDRGNFFLHSGQLRRADADLSSAIDLFSERPELWNDRAVVRMEQKLHREAASDLEEALRLRPTFASAWSNLGNALRHSGHLERAKHAYNSALLLEPTDARVWNNRGALQEQMGNLVAAELDVTRAIGLGGCPKAAANRARIAELLARAEMELQPLQPCGLAAEHTRTFAFGAGPLGLLLVNATPTVDATPAVDGGAVEAAAAAADDGATGEVAIAAVYEDTQASRAGVPVGALVVGLNGSSVGACGHAELTRRIQQTPRPLTLLLRMPRGRGGPPGAPGAAQEVAKPRGCASVLSHEDAAARAAIEADAVPLPPGGATESIPGIS